MSKYHVKHISHYNCCIQIRKTYYSTTALMASVLILVKLLLIFSFNNPFINAFLSFSDYFCRFEVIFSFISLYIYKSILQLKEKQTKCFQICIYFEILLFFYIPYKVHNFVFNHRISTNLDVF